MRVYNKGSRLYTYHDLEIPPQRFTQVPEKHEAGVKELITKFPHELSDGGQASEDMQSKDALIKQQDAEIKTLKAQVKKLQGLLTQAPAISLRPCLRASSGRVSRPAWE